MMKAEGERGQRNIRAEDYHSTNKSKQNKRATRREMGSPSKPFLQETRDKLWAERATSTEQAGCTNSFMKLWW